MIYTSLQMGVLFSILVCVFAFGGCGKKPAQEQAVKAEQASHKKNTKNKSSQKKSSRKKPNPTRANKKAKFNSSLAKSAKGGRVLSKKQAKKFARKYPFFEPSPPPKGMARLYVTASCLIGNVPGYDLPVVPLQATVLITDKKYNSKLNAYFVKRAYDSDDLDDIFLQGDTDKNGRLDMRLIADDEVKIATIPSDKRFGDMDFMNKDWGSVKVRNGKIATVNYIISQADCDKGNNLPIRDIVPGSYQIQYSSFSKSYDWAKRAEIHATELMQYHRMAGDGVFEKVDAPTMFNQDKKDIKLNPAFAPIVINNIQTEHVVARECRSGDRLYTLKETTRVDAALGVKTIFGEANGHPYQCKEAWVTHFPYFYDPYKSVSNHSARETSLRILDEGYKLRSTCEAEDIRPSDTVPPSYPSGCMESDIFYVTIFTAEDKPPLTWGMPRKYGIRFDITRWEDVKGVVPRTLIP